MIKKLTLLSFTALAMLVGASNAQAATILIGGTSLTLVYDAATDTLCDEGGCALVDTTGDFADAATLTSLDFEVDGNPVGSIDSPPSEIYVDVFLSDVQLDPNGGFQADNTISGFIDFYTVSADGLDYLQLNVVSGTVVYDLNGQLSVAIGTANALYDQELSYSFGNFIFTDPDITWAFSSSASTVTNTGFNTTGTPDWADQSVEFDTPVPEPGSMLLLGSGLMGLAASARRRLRRKNQ